MRTRKSQFNTGREKTSRYSKAMVHPVRLYILLFLAMTSTAGSMGVTPIPTSKIEVYYFHFTERTQTSLNIENVTRNAILSLYPVKVKRGEIFFKSVNLDDKDGAALGAKFKVKKQALVVILLDKRVDLTKKGNMYADKYPEKLTEEIKKAVESVIKQAREAEKQ